MPFVDVFLLAFLPAVAGRRVYDHHMGLQGNSVRQLQGRHEDLLRSWLLLQIHTAYALCPC